MVSRMFLSLQNKQIKKTVFIDRDGVINKDSKAYIKSWSEFIFLPRSISAVTKLTRHHFHSYIITNQSVINRKMVSLKTLALIHTNMMAEMASAGGHIDDIFFCPHIPEDRCLCRKPKPGLVLSAQKKHHIDLSSAYMIGDSAKDIMCAKLSGCGFALLVKTGNYVEAVTTLSEKGIVPDYTALDLYDAATWIIDHQESSESGSAGRVTGILKN
jgi:D-glycero-D-manno-heptose 1,7-bisphosphate phosphatase